MGVADGIFTDEEDKYFESRGRSEPTIIGGESGGGEAEVEQSERVPEPEHEPVSEEPDATVGESASESGDTENFEGSEADAGDRESSDEAKPARNFEKAYHSERHKRVEMREKLAETQRQNEEMRQYFAQQQQQQQQQPSQAAPSEADDPLGYYQHQLKETNAKVEQQQQYMQQQAQAQQHNDQLTQFVSSYKASAREFAEQQPDFTNAYKHLEQSRISEYQKAGYSKQQAVQLLHEDEVSIALKAYQDGVNPAERLYAMAESRGYNATQTPKRGLENVAKGVKKAKTLASSTSNTASDAVDMGLVDDMTDAEFDKFFKKTKAKQKREESKFSGW